MGRSKKVTQDASASSSNVDPFAAGAAGDTTLRAERGKIVVSLRPFDLSNNQIMINFAQEEFFSVFQYTQESLPIPLSQLFGEATDRKDIRMIETAVSTKKSHVGYVVLYRSDGYGLPCHVSTLSVQGDADSSGKKTMVLGSASTERWSVLTIRNANAVGNAKFCGVGLLGLDRVLPEKLEEIGKDPAATGSASSSSSSSATPHAI